VLGDFMDKGGYAEGSATCSAATSTSMPSRCSRPEEIDPQLTGDLKLRDVEDDDTGRGDHQRPAAQEVQGEPQAYCTELKDHCTRRGITYLFTSTRVPFDTLVLAYLRQRGLLR
jgi:hypothetical protein